MPEYTRRKQSQSEQLEDLLRSRIADARGPVTEKSLPEDVRSDFESRSGYSARNIRVVESDLPQATYANAVTQGSTIHFPRGGYNPADAEGRRVLLHELSHTVQQARGEVRPNFAGQINETPALEQAADRGFSASESGAAPGAAPAPMPSAPAGAPMQRDGTTLDRIAQEHGMTKEEVLQNSRWWTRRKLKKQDEKEERERQKKLFADTIAAMEARLTGSRTPYDAHLEEQIKALPDPDEKGIGIRERHKRKKAREQLEKQRQEHERINDQMMEEMLLQQLGGAGGSDEKEMREAIRKARRHNQKEQLRHAYEKTDTVQRLTETDKLGVYDERQRKYVADGGAHTQVINAGTPAGQSAGQDPLSHYEQLGQRSERLNKAASYTDKGATAVDVAAGSGEKVREAHQLLGIDGGKAYEQVSKSTAAAHVSGMSSLGGVVSNGLDAVESAVQARQSAIAGDREGQIHHTLDSAAKGSGALQSFYSAFGQDGLGPAVNMVIPAEAATGAGIAQNVFTAARSASDLHAAHKRKKQFDAIRGQEDVSYDSGNREQVEAYEAANLGRYNAKKDEATASVELAGAVAGTAGNVASLIPGAQPVGAALTGVSKSAALVKAATGKGMQHYARNKVVGDLMSAAEVQRAEQQVNTSTLDEEDKVKAMARASHAKDAKQLYNRMVAHQATRLHQNMGTGQASEYDTRIMQAAGFDPSKHGAVPLEMINKRMGGVVSAQEGLVNREERKAAKQEAREAETRAAVIKAAEVSARNRGNGETYNRYMNRTLQTLREGDVQLPEQAQPRQPVVRPVSPAEAKRREAEAKRQQEEMAYMQRYGVARRQRPRKKTNTTPTASPRIT